MWAIIVRKEKYDDEPYSSRVTVSEFIMFTEDKAKVKALKQLERSSSLVKVKVEITNIEDGKKFRLPTAYYGHSE